MSTYGAYAEYKDSGIDWVGDIPSGWTVRPLFRHAAQSKRSNRGMVNDNLLSLSYGAIVRKDIEAVEGLLPASFETYQLVDANDIVFRLTDLQNDKRSLRSALCSEDGIITSAYVAVRVREAHPTYLSYLMRGYDLTKVFYSLGSGLRQSLKYSEMKRLPVLIPSLEEQTQIAKFLDYETAKIDTLIGKQEELIVLLKEKRQAVISHAVTKGLNPDASMRHSGVEWLGKVPAHWTVGALSQALNAIGDVDHYMPPSVDTGVPYVMTGDLEDLASEIDFARCKQVAHHDYLRLCKKIKTTKGDLIMARYATIGTVSYVDLESDFLVSYSCVTIKPNAKKSLGRYLFFCLKSDSFAQGIRERINTNTQDNVGIADLSKVKVALPAMEEQTKVAEYLQAKVSEMDRVLESSEAAIDLLQERRTALISAAVTGKIDVRSWKPHSSADPITEAEAS